MIRLLLVHIRYALLAAVAECSFSEQSARQAYVPALSGVDFRAEEPQLFLDVGIWHPLAPTMYDDIKEYLNWWVCCSACGPMV